MSNSRAEAFAPATVANLGVGFDILGVAVSGSGDVISVEKTVELGAKMIHIDGDNGRLPMEADQNLATIAANALLKAVNADFGVGIRLQKGLPLSSGLGSSAASSVAAVVAVNALLDKPLEHKALLPYAMEGEAFVSGYHADNVAPCLLGGMTLILGTKIDDITQLPIPDNFWLALVTPNVAVPTAEARAVLPATIPLKTMVQQTAAAAKLIDAIYRGDLVAMAVAMEEDGVIEPARAHLMPCIDDVKREAKAAGAYSVVIGGAGPTLCAICDGEAKAAEVVAAMQAVYDAANIESISRISQILTQGAHLISAS